MLVIGNRIAYPPTPSPTTPPSLPAPLQVRSDAVEALSPPSKDVQATRKLRLGWRKLQVRRWPSGEGG